MSWFKVDDQMHSSRKVKSIPRRDRLAAVGLWTLAGSWSSQELTEGFIPAYMLEEFGGTPRLAQALCDARAGSTHGLWEACAGGWRFHDWDQFNPSKEKVLDEREKARERQQRARDKARQKRVTEESRRDDGVTHAVTSPLVTRESRGESRAPRPDPTRPDPLIHREAPQADASAPSKTKKGTRLPDDWMPSDDVREAMLAELPNVDFRAEHLKFSDHWKAQPGSKGVKSDWDAVWRNWMRRAGEFAPRHLWPVADPGPSIGHQVIGEPPEDLLRQHGILQ